MLLMSRYLKLVRKPPLKKASDQIVLTKQTKQKTLCAIFLFNSSWVCVHAINILNFSFLWVKNRTVSEYLLCTIPSLPVSGYCCISVIPEMGYIVWQGALRNSVMQSCFLEYILFLPVLSPKKASVLGTVYN